jgi:hypothetical protein
VYPYCQTDRPLPWGADAWGMPAFDAHLPRGEPAHGAGLPMLRFVRAANPGSNPPPAAAAEAPPSPDWAGAEALEAREVACEVERRQFHYFEVTLGGEWSAERAPGEDDACCVAIGLSTRAVRAALGRLSALSVFLLKSILYGVFVWAHRALKHQKRRFLARAVRHERQAAGLGPQLLGLPL